MKMKMKTLLIVTAALVGLSQQVSAAGFYVGEQSAIANGMGLAVTAKLMDPGTISFNPAGMAFLPGLHVSAGILMAVPVFKFSDPNGIDPSMTASKNPNWIPHVYATYTFLNNKLSFGLGFNVPYGLVVAWPKGFSGGAYSQKVDLKIMHMYFGVAWRFAKHWSIGAVFKAAPSSAMFEQDYQVGTDSGKLATMSAKVSGSGWGFGGGIGIMGEPFKGFHLGVSYTSRMKLSLNGDAHFDLPSDFHDFSVFHDQGGGATMWIPDIIAVGLGYDITKDVYIEFDFNYTLWSVYNELPVTFDNDPSGQLSSVSKKNWKNTPTFRLAASWNVIPALTLRLGGGYDISPVPDSTLDPMLPDANRFFASFGIGYNIKKIGLRFDLSYSFVKFMQRTVTAADSNPFPATYNGMAHLVGLTVGYAL